MHKIVISLLVSFLFGFNTSYSQVKNFGNGLTNGIEISKKSYITNAIYIPNYINNSKEAHSYFIYQNQLVLQIDGSGKLYKILDTSVKRIDSTVLEGGTFGAYNFVYRDTIFSLGGYGFWVFNGVLRYYKNEKKEWSIIPTNLTFPINTRTYSKIWYDRKNEKIYVIYKNPELIYLKKEQNDNNYYLQCLDLKSKNWWNEPKMIEENFRKMFSDFFQEITISTNYGLIVLSEKSIYFIDINQNEIRSLDNKKFQAYYEFLLGGKVILYYENKGVIYSLGEKFVQIDSLKYLRSDFVGHGTKIYSGPITKTSDEKIWPYFTILILIGLLFILTYFYFNKKQKATQTNLPNLTITSFYDKLNEVERSLLKLIVINSKNNLCSDIEQLNKVLGISNKPLKIQNNIRANTIMMINKKFMVYANTIENLIEKKRTEEDKRFYEYFIQIKLIDFLN